MGEVDEGPAGKLADVLTYEATSSPEVAVLEALLAKAREGKVLGLVILSESVDALGARSWGWERSGGDSRDVGRTFHMVGLLELVKGRLLDTACPKSRDFL